MVAGYGSIHEGAEALLRVPGSGLVPATLEFFDGNCLDACRPSFPLPLNRDTRFLVVSECDGTPGECANLTAQVAEALAPAIEVHTIKGRSALGQMERWRNSVSFAVRSLRGGKMSEDIAVPVDRVGDAIAATLEIGKTHSLTACSWGARR